VKNNIEIIGVSDIDDVLKEVFVRKN